MTRFETSSGDGSGLDDPAIVTLEPDVTALVERFVRDSAGLAFAAAVDERRRLQPVAVGVTMAAGCAFALLTGLVLLTVATLEALSTVLSGWRAPLVLGGAWMLLGLGGLQRLAPVRRLRPVLSRGPERAAAAAAAEQQLRATIEELTKTIAGQAERRLAAALLPITGRFVETGEKVVDAADEMIEAADEVTDVIEERLPGGVLVNRVVDVALVPGRFGIRVVRRVFEIGQP